MKPVELSGVIYNWVDLVLNTNLLYSIPIIYENPIAPAPSSPYIVIGNPFAIGKQGRSVAADTREDGSRTVIQDMEATISIIEVGEYNDDGTLSGGDGRFLQDLSMSIETSEIQQFFKTNNVAYRIEEDMSPSPREMGAEWDLTEIMDIRFGFAASVEEVGGWIGAVDYMSDFT